MMKGPVELGMETTRRVAVTSIIHGTEFAGNYHHKTIGNTHILALAPKPVVELDRRPPLNPQFGVNLHLFELLPLQGGLLAQQCARNFISPAAGGVLLEVAAAAKHQHRQVVVDNLLEALVVTLDGEVPVGGGGGDGGDGGGVNCE